MRAKLIRWTTIVGAVIGGACFLLVVLAIILNASGYKATANKSTKPVVTKTVVITKTVLVTVTPAPTAAPTQTSTPAATPTPSATGFPSIWPLRTTADAIMLGDLWSGPKLPVIRRTRGYTGCWCNIAVQVPRRLHGKRLAEALLHFFYSSGLSEQGDVLLLGYHSRKDMTTRGPAFGGYTAGRISYATIPGDHEFEVDTDNALAHGGHDYTIHDQ
jgi:hypothetical protein